MSLDELKKDWQENSGEVKSDFDNESLQKIFKARVAKQMREPFRYFWASFVMQVILYAFMSHLIIKNLGNASVQIYSVVCILLYIPFTWVLLSKFRRMAAQRLNPGDSIMDSLALKSAQLQGFFTFKKRYETVQIPLSCALGVILPFELFMPGSSRTPKTRRLEGRTRHDQEDVRAARFLSPRGRPGRRVRGLLEGGDHHARAALGRHGRLRLRGARPGGR